jgi:D-arabinose 1-dehydrogenase-like Zn-dependent alcohol dehydrogenase
MQLRESGVLDKHDIDTSFFFKGHAARKHSDLVTAEDPILVTRGPEMSKRRDRILLVALLTGSPLHLRAYKILSKELEFIGNMSINRKDANESSR